MAQYNFRLRFHLPGNHFINSDAAEILILEDCRSARVRLLSEARGMPIKDNSDVALVGGPYPNPSDAQEAAERAKRALLIWAIRNRTGIDLGGRPPRGVITTAGRQWLEHLENRDASRF